MIDFDEVSDNLRSKIQEFQDYLISRKVKSKVVIDCVDFTLIFKHKGKSWALDFYTSDISESRSLLEASVKIKCAAVPFFPKIIEKMEENRTVMYDSMVKAIEIYDSFDFPEVGNQ